MKRMGKDEDHDVEDEDEDDDAEHDDAEHDDDEHDEDEAPRAAAAKVHPLKQSTFQHGFNAEPILYKVPRWAAIVPGGVDRAVLGTIDFMLGLHVKGKRLNALRPYLRVDAEGTPWYVVTRGQLRRWIAASSTKQVRNAVDRLVARELVFRETHTRGKARVAMRLRLNWPAIEAAVAALVPQDEEGE